MCAPCSCTPLCGRADPLACSATTACKSMSSLDTSIALIDRSSAAELDLPAERRVVKSIGERTPPCCSKLSVMDEQQKSRGSDKAGLYENYKIKKQMYRDDFYLKVCLNLYNNIGMRGGLLCTSINGEAGKSVEGLEGSFAEGNISRGVWLTTMKESRVIEQTGNAIAERRGAADLRRTQVDNVGELGSQGRETAQAR